MNVILESPVSIGIFGLVLVGLLVVTAIQLGERKAVVGAIAVLVMTIALIVTSIAIETNQEQLIRTVHELATALQANDHQRALSYLHPNAVPAIQRAQQDLASVEFKEAKVTSIRSVSINENSPPPTAIMEFIGVVNASSTRYSGGVPVKAARLFKTYWMLQNDRWLIRDYEHSDVRSALAN